MNSSATLSNGRRFVQRTPQPRSPWALAVRPLRQLRRPFDALGAALGWEGGFGWGASSASDTGGANGASDLGVSRRAAGMGGSGGSGGSAGSGAARMPASAAAALRQMQQRFAAADAATLAQAALALRAELRPHDRATAAGARALGLAAAALQQTLGLQAYETQLHCAWLMLDGALVEMATGEGKTVAAALAAASAALCGTPVHVLTANDYLVQRDQATMAAFFSALQLSSACVTGPLQRAERQRAYRADVVYTTGREIAFDYLKDHLQLGAERDPRWLRAQALQADAVGVTMEPDTATDAARVEARDEARVEARDAARDAATDAAFEPVLPGLHCAIVDEADSILLDEASIPFVLSGQGAAPDVAALQSARFRALSLAPEEFALLPGQRDAQLTEAGRARVTRALLPGSVLWPSRRAFELIRSALVAQHLLQRDRDYAVTADGVQLIDEVTGRIALGRQWTGSLHAMVELKEGLAPSPALTTAARMNYQRLFPRYLHLGGMSGTLLEAAAELEALYGCRVLRVPRSQPSKAQWLGTRCFADAAARWQAVAQRAALCVAQGRAVLVGTDSVAASQALAACLAAQGLQACVLNAVQDADEAAAVAAAGQPGRITVATNIAGRGTDIQLAPAVRAAGGLHVILALANRSRRIDRQLLGRSARHGDPGSAERLLALDDALLRSHGHPAALAWLRQHAGADGSVSTRAARALLAWAQRSSEWRERSLRRELRLADAGLSEPFAFAGSTE